MRASSSKIKHRSSNQESGSHGFNHFSIQDIHCVAIVNNGCGCCVGGNSYSDGIGGVVIRSGASSIDIWHAKLLGVEIVSHEISNSRLAVQCVYSSICVWAHYIVLIQCIPKVLKRAKIWVVNITTWWASGALAACRASRTNGAVWSCSARCISNCWKNSSVAWHMISKK